MTDVQVPFGDNPSETATLLLAAAEKSKDHSADDVRTGSFATFYVPEEIAKAAGVDYVDDDDVDAPEMGSNGNEDEKPVAKKAAAKKTASTTEKQE